MLTAPQLQPTGEMRRHATDESDVAAALVRTAFMIAFAVPLQLMPGPEPAPRPVVAILLMGSCFTLLVFASYLRGFPFPFRRPVAIVADLLLVTAAIAVLEPSAPQRQWVVALYYLVIMLAAIWYRRTGAIMTALTAGVLDGIVRLALPPLYLWEMLKLGQMVPMLMIGVAVSYLVLARDREREHASRLDQDLRMARRLQDQMLPATLPETDGLELGLQFQPARLVGGDIYDGVKVDDRTLIFCIGDMPGKSVHGLVHLSLVHSHMRAGALAGLAPSVIATTINANVYDTLQPSSYAPLFIGSVDLATRKLTFVNCGHLPPILVRGGDASEYAELSSGDIVIGGKPEPEYGDVEVQLRPGDIVVGYTDGITEARDRQRRQFGIRRLVDVVESHRDEGAQAVADALLAATDSFSTDALMDDRTVLVLRAV